MAIDEQTLFDNAALGIAGQGYKQACDDNDYTVLTEDGRRCALGWSVTDAVVGQKRTPQFIALSRTSLGNALVYAHDIVLARGADAWREDMARIALQYGLDDSALYFRPFGE